MSDDLDKLDYYSLLGVRRAASLDDIKRAFRAFARRYHPDRYSQAPPEKIARATEIYRRGGEAFQVLSDATLRAAYDAAFLDGRVRMTAEDQDRARADARPVPRPTRPSMSPQARAYYERAALAARERDWRAAYRALQAASQIDPHNERIAHRLEQVEARIRSRPGH